MTDAAHPFFHIPHNAGLGEGDPFGYDRQNPGRQPLGHESDVRLSTLMDFTRRMPSLAGLPDDLHDPQGIRLLAVGRFGSDGRLGTVRDYAHRILPDSVRNVDDSLCDVIHGSVPVEGRFSPHPASRPDGPWQFAPAGAPS